MATSTSLSPPATNQLAPEAYSFHVADASVQSWLTLYARYQRAKDVPKTCLYVRTSHTLSMESAPSGLDGALKLNNIRYLAPVNGDFARRLEGWNVFGWSSWIRASSWQVAVVSYWAI